MFQAKLMRATRLYTILLTCFSVSASFGQTTSLRHTFDVPTPTLADEFGTSVSIDGNNILIGAPGNDSNGGNVGQAHLFDVTTGNLVFTFDVPTPTLADEFGASVAILSLIHI